MRHQKKSEDYIHKSVISGKYLYRIHTHIYFVFGCVVADDRSTMGVVTV